MNEIDRKYDEVIDACIDNGERLLEDAKYLHEYDRFPSAMALAILSQEEFAKAYIMILVNEGAIPWCEEISRATKDHSCKHLMTLIMEYLFVPWDQLLEHTKDYYNKLYPPKLPDNIADALDIFCHEKIRRWKANNWVWAEDPVYNKDVKAISKGKIDKIKQGSLYVSLTKTGMLKKIPACDSESAMKQIEYAEIISDVARGHDVHKFFEREQIKKILKRIFEHF